MVCVHKLRRVGISILGHEPCELLGQPCGAVMPAEGDEKKRSDCDAVEGKYANYFQVGHNAFEFLLEFGQSYPEIGAERIHTRIIMSPAYALEFLKLLRESIQVYEEAFGVIAGEES